MKSNKLQAKRANTLKINTLSSEISCLVTGFDPFNNSYSNPSAEIAMAFPRRLRLNEKQISLSVKSFVLPSVGDEAWDLLKAQMDQLPKRKKTLVIMLGQARGRKLISLERFALNWRDYKIKDNSGRLIRAQQILPGKPEALRTTAPVDIILKKLQAKNVDVEISNYAGTYVCNELYFQVLNYLKATKKPIVAYFIHVPLLAVYGKTLANSKSKKWKKYAVGRVNQLKAQVQAIQMLAKFSALELVK